MSSIPLSTSPSLTDQLSVFQTPTYYGNNYGARLRGYICTPASGNYTFWIASDDHSELWLSTDENPLNKKRIAYVSGATSPAQWTKYASQTSAAITLQAGKRYYIEALHKEALGNDHIAVGWQLPDGSLERPINGNRLMPFQSENALPIVTITSPNEGGTFTAPASISITATASDADGSISKVEFYNGTTKLGEDLSSPYSYGWNNVVAGAYRIVAKAIDNTGGISADEVNISVASVCTASGTIYREIWLNITGTDISSIPVNTAPDVITSHTMFETPTYYANSYGSRMRGYLCAPATGNYTFWVASDDASQLWLSTDSNAGNRQLIASVSGATSVKQWDKYASQRSAQIALTKDQRYYIEVLHKEALGNDHFAIGWQLPDGVFERPIPGTRLSPFDAGMALSFSLHEQTLSAAEGELAVFPNPYREGELKLIIPQEVLTGAGEMQIEIISASGEVVHREWIPCDANCNEVVVSLERKLSGGIYLVQATSGRRRMAKKLMVE